MSYYTNAANETAVRHIIEIACKKKIGTPIGDPDPIFFKNLMEVSNRSKRRRNDPCRQVVSRSHSCSYNRFPHSLSAS